MLGCMYRALCVVGFRLASATKPRQPVDNRKKVDNTRKKTWREEEVVRAEVIGYRGIDWYRLDGNSTSTNHRIYGKPTAPLKAFGRLQLRNVRLAPTTNAMMAYTDCRRT